MLKRWLRSFWWAVHGFHTVWQEEKNFRIEAIVGVFVLIAAAVFRFSCGETGLVVVAIVIVLTGEIVNTAMEDLCNKVQPKQDRDIAKIKDIMAAFVLLSALGAIALGLLTFGNHFL